MVALLAILSVIPVGIAAMITGDFSQMVYKPKRSAVFLILKHRLALCALSIFLWLAAVVLHIFVNPTSLILLKITGVLVLIQLILGFVMSPYIMFPAIRRPNWLSVEDADTIISGDEPVIGLVINGDARAYPVNWTFRPHIVEDTVGGEPVAMTYCLLSNLGLAFKPELNGQPMNFIMPIQWENNMMIFDTRGGRLIQQINGDVMFGPDAGEKLDKYPTEIISWSAWKESYPTTRVLNNPVSGLFDRFVRFFIGQFFLKVNREQEAPMFPTIKVFDERLPNKTEVLALEKDGVFRAYTIDYIRHHGVVNDTLKDAHSVLMCKGERVSVFSRLLNGQILNFERVLDNDIIIVQDSETRSQWDGTGRAVSGFLEGNRLESINYYSRILWYIWVNFHPDTELVS